jgi:hypothetical protein
MSNGHFVLPLLDESARSDDQTAFQVAPDQQLLDQQPSLWRITGRRNRRNSFFE